MEQRPYLAANSHSVNRKKNPHIFKKPKESLQRLQDAKNLYTEPHASSPQYSFNVHFNIILPTRARSFK